MAKPQKFIVKPEWRRMAALVVQAKNEGDFDDEELENAIAMTIAAAHQDQVDWQFESFVNEQEKSRARWRKKYDAKRDEYLARRRARSRQSYEKLMADPERREHNNEMRRLRRKEKGDEIRAIEKARRAQRKAENPEAFKETVRAKQQRAMERNPERFREKDRRRRTRAALRARGPEILKLAMDSVPITYPQHIRDDVAASVVTAVMELRFPPEEIKANMKSIMTAYWRDRPEYRQTSMDAQRFDDGKATLHDTVTEGLW